MTVSRIVRHDKVNSHKDVIFGTFESQFHSLTKTAGTHTHVLAYRKRGGRVAVFILCTATLLPAQLVAPLPASLQITAMLHEKDGWRKESQFLPFLVNPSNFKRPDGLATCMRVQVDPCYYWSSEYGVCQDRLGKEAE